MPELTDEQKAMCNIYYLTKRKKEKNDNVELKLQKKLCEYLQTYYPDVYFVSDALGLFVLPSIRQTLKATNSNHKHLDIVILKKSGMYSGLILEVKKETPFKQDGSLRQDEHLDGQQKSIDMLRAQLFRANFVWQYDQGIKMINDYLGIPDIDDEPLFP